MRAQVKIERQTFLRGFRTVLPLWLGGAPFGILYAVAANHAGLRPAEILLMSLLIYSSATQMALLPLLAGGAGLLSVVFTAIALNVHYLLYGLTLRARMRLSWVERALAAYGLTDAAYGFTIAESDRAGFSFLMGAETSIFTVWTLSTGIGVLLGEHVLNLPTALTGFVAPLSFFVLLIAAVKSGVDLTVAAVAVGCAVLCLRLDLGMVAIPVATIAGALYGAAVTSPRAARTTEHGY